MVVMGCIFFVIFFNAVIYPDIEIKGFSNINSCTGECYEEYIKVHGTAPEIERRKQAIAATDEFSSIKPVWAGCAACHGQEGEGGVGPKLAGQTADYISGRLNAYKNKEETGPMSAMMWGQAGMLSDNDIDTIGKFIQGTMK